MRSRGCGCFRFIVTAFTLCLIASVVGPTPAHRVSAALATSGDGQAGPAYRALPFAQAAPRPGAAENSGTATPIPYSIPVISWPTPTSITYGTPLDGVELDASVTYSGFVVPGILTYTPSSGTILHAGANQELLAGFAPSVSNFAGATGSVLLTVNPAPTTLSLTTSPVPLGSGGPLTLTAAISTTATGAGLPVGSITFYDGSAMLGSPVPLVSGSARITLPRLTAGAHNFNASYAAVPNSLGNPDFAPSTAAALIGAGQAATQLLLGATNSLSYIGQSVSYAARVTSANGGTPTGTVTFFDITGSAPKVLGSGQLDSSGYAHATQAASTLGAIRILAVYGGDGQFQGAQSAVLTQVIRSCTVTAHLALKSTVLLDALVGSQATVSTHVTFGFGKSQIRIGNAVVSYCSNPGRSNAQAMVSGSVTVSSGVLKKGDQVSVTLHALGAARFPDAVLVDLTVKQRVVVSGPYDGDSALHINTP